MGKWKQMPRQMTAAAMAAVLALSSPALSFAVKAQTGSAGRTASASEASRDEGEEREKTASASDAEKNSCAGSGSRATASDAKKEVSVQPYGLIEEGVDNSWTLTTTGGTLYADGNETNPVEKLEGQKGTFINAEGAVLQIDATSGKFALQAERTQVNHGTKLTVPTAGAEAVLLIIEAHKNWRGGDGTEEEKLAGAAKSLKAEGVISCTVEEVETTTGGDYELYYYLCVLEEEQESLTVEVTIPSEFANNAYLKSFSVESTEAPEAGESYPVTLNLDSDVDLSDYDLHYRYVNEGGLVQLFDPREEIKLEDGTWRLNLLDGTEQCPYDVEDGETITVNGAGVTQNATVGPITSWDLANETDLS